MNIITTITNDILMRTVTNITTSVVSTHSLFVWFIDYKNSNYNIYQNEIKLTDLQNKLLCISALIKDIFKRFYFEKNADINDKISQFIKNTSNDIIKDGFTLIDYNMNESLHIFTEIPDCIKLSLISTLEIITILNNEIYKITTRIQEHHKRWISYIYSIKIEEEMNSILIHNAIFDKRLNLLFQILHVY